MELHRAEKALDATLRAVGGSDFSLTLFFFFAIYISGRARHNLTCQEDSVRAFFLANDACWHSLAGANGVQISRGAVREGSSKRRERRTGWFWFCVWLESERRLFWFFLDFLPPPGFALVLLR